MLRMLVLISLSTVTCSITKVSAQELWNNQYAHIFEGVTNEENPSDALISIRASKLHNNQVTLLAKLWTGTINVDPNGGEDGVFDTFDEPNAFRRLALIAYQTDGSFLWRKTISSAVNDPQAGVFGMVSSADGVMSIGTDGTLHVLSAFNGQVDVSADGSGAFVNSVPFGPDQLQVQSIYTASYSQNGDLLNANVIASHNSQFGTIYARAITTSNDGSSYALIAYNTDIVIHTPEGDQNFGSRPEAPNLYDIILLKLNTQGEVDWTKLYAGDPTGIPLNGISTDESGNITFAGRWSGVLDLNPDNPGSLTMEVSNLMQWGVFWSKFTPDGTWLAGDAYTRSGPIVNLRDFHLAPDGTVNIVLNNAPFNMLNSGQEVEAPSGSFETRFVQYAPNGNLNMVRDNMPNGNVFSDADGNPAIVVMWVATMNGEPVDFNEGAGDPLIFDGITGSYRFLLQYDNALNLVRAGAINLLPSGSSGARGLPIALNNDELILTIEKFYNHTFVPGFSDDNVYTFADKGFVHARYAAQYTAVSGHSPDNAPLLYPNPTRGEVQIRLTHREETAEALMTDPTGRVLLSIQAEEQVLQQEIMRILSSQAIGLYILAITQRDQRHSIRVIKIGK